MIVSPLCVACSPRPPSDPQSSSASLSLNIPVTSPVPLRRSRRSSFPVFLLRGGVKHAVAVIALTDLWVVSAFLFAFLDGLNFL
jgi:hypothetical protein